MPLGRRFVMRGRLSAPDLCNGRSKGATRGCAPVAPPPAAAGERRPGGSVTWRGWLACKPRMRSRGATTKMRGLPYATDPMGWQHFRNLCDSALGRAPAALRRALHRQRLEQPGGGLGTLQTP